MKRAYQLLRPFAYLTVRGPNLNGYRFYGPLVLAILASALFWLLPVPPKLVGDKSAADLMTGFFVALPGFYIAALAAVVAFNGGDLDKEMPGVSVKMEAQGDVASVEITLRVFLSYLFSYLTLAAFLGFFVCVGAELLAPSLSSWLGSLSLDAAYWCKTLVEILFVLLIGYLGASVVLCTVQGLYFLAERVHQNLL